MKKIKSNEKKKYFIRGIVLILIGIVASWYVITTFSGKDQNPFENSTKITDAKKFKSEYEDLNKDSLKVEISQNNPIKYINYKELMEILEDGTGIIYFGFPSCPWCRNAVPVLLDAAKENDINEIYYFNAKDMRDEKELDENGSIVVKNEGTEEYKKLIEKLYDYLDVYKGLHDDTIKRLYFPNVFFISNGKVVGNHMATVESQTDPKVALTTEQYNELKNIYIENIKKVYNYECNDGC